MAQLLKGSLNLAGVICPYSQDQVVTAVVAPGCSHDTSILQDVCPFDVIPICKHMVVPCFAIAKFDFVVEIMNWTDLASEIFFVNGVFR
jgi:hypothetical protein